MDVQIADQSGKPLQLPAAEKKVQNAIIGKSFAILILLNTQGGVFCEFGGGGARGAYLRPSM